MTERVEISKRLLLINSASSIATQLLSITVLIWLQQYLLKRISPDEYQLLPLLYSIMVFAPLVTTILTGGLGQYIVEAYAKSDDARITQIVSTMFPILCAAGAMFLLIGCALAWFIGDVLTIAPEYIWDARTMMAILMFSTAIRLPFAPFGVGLFVRQKFVLQNIIGLCSELFRLTVLFTLLFGVSTRVLWVVVASAAADMLALTVQTVYSVRYLPALRYHKSSTCWSIARAITSFGGWTFVNSLFGTILRAADPIILNRLATPVDVTSFYIGSLPVRQFQSLYSASIPAMLSPVIISLSASDQHARLKSLFLRIGRYSVWVSLLFATPLAVTSTDVMRLYAGESYGAAAIVMLLLLAYFPTAYASVLLWPIASAQLMVKSLAWRSAIENSLNLALTLYLVGALHMGAIGSALSSVLCVYVCHLVLWWPFAFRLLRLNLREIFSETIYPGLLPALGSGALISLIYPRGSLTSWLTVGFYAVLVGISYVFLVWLVMTPTDQAETRKAWSIFYRRLWAYIDLVKLY